MTLSISQESVSKVLFSIIGLHDIACACLGAVENTSVSVIYKILIG